jgi:RND family efflux transporter MFP subunit
MIRLVEASNDHVRDPRPHKSVRRKRKYRTRMRSVLSTILLAASVAVAGCSKSDNQGPGRPGGFPGAGTIPSVEAVQSRIGSLPLEERLSGIVRAENQVVIFSEISAPVVRVAAQNGDYVNTGDPLVYLRDKQYRDQVNQAEAALTIARADARRAEATLDEVRNRLERNRKLAEKQLLSAQQIESLEAELSSAQAAYSQADARISQAEATLEERREALRRTIVTAPSSGYVGQRNVEVGMRVDPNTPLYMLGDFDRVRIDVSVTDEMITRIETGQTALISIDDRPDTTIVSQVSRISPFLEAGSFSAQAEIDVENGGHLLRPGMFVAVDVLYGESRQATLVPESAVFENPTNGRMGVYVAPSLAEETPVQSPDTYDEQDPPAMTEPTPMEFRQVQVLARGRGMAGVAGIRSGEWVITVGQNMLATRTGQVQARVQPTTWERVSELQVLQDQDLLRQFMEKQQRVADSVFSGGGATGEGTPASGAEPTVQTGSAAGAAE